MDLYPEMQTVVWNPNPNPDLVDKKRFCWVPSVLHPIEPNKLTKLTLYFINKPKEYSLKHCIVLGFFNVRI